MKYIKYYFGMALLGLASCQKDNQEFPFQEETIKSTISLQEAQDFLSQRKNENEDFFLFPDWKTFTKENIASEHSYAQVKTQVFTPDTEGELLFLKVKDTLSSYLLVSKVDKENPAIERIFFFTSEGVLVDGYMFEDGELTHSMLPVRLAGYRIGERCREIQREARKKGLPEANFPCYDLDDVVVVYKREKNPTKCKNITGKSGSCEASLLDFMYKWYDCLPDDIDCLDRKISENTSDFRKLMREIMARRRSTGGKGSGGNKHEERIDSIYHDFKNYRCANQLVNELPRLNNRIANLVKKTFQADGRINIRFEAKKLNDNIDGKVLPHSKSVMIDNELYAEQYIAINKDILAKSSKEYILVTMYHEALHAYLNTQQTILGDVEFNRKYPNIEQVYLPFDKTERVKKYKIKQGDNYHGDVAHFIKELAQAIISFNPKIPIEEAYVMAKVGIVEDIHFSEQEKRINEEHRNGSAKNGTKCEK